MTESALDVAHGLVAAHLAHSEANVPVSPFLDLALQQLAAWMADLTPGGLTPELEDLTLEIVKLVSALSGTAAWFARFATGDLPDGRVLDVDLTQSAGELVAGEFKRLRDLGL